MKKIYHNFDKLDVAFQGAFPPHILEELEAAKFAAQKKNEPALAYLGKDQIKVKVQQTGSAQGYTYIFDTGLDGEKWSVIKSQDTTRWNIGVSVSSMGLALHGYEAVKQRIYALLESFEVKAPSTISPKTGKPHTSPIEAIGRVDYCIDFVTNHFEPDPDNVIGYRLKKKTTSSSFSASGTSKENETMLAGKLPNRQVTLYNKIKEVKAKPAEKSYWWDVWGINPKTFDKQIWRVEARAGKRELKDYWQIYSFEDLETKIGDVMAYILSKYRYATPNPHDKNKARWKNAPFWDEAITTVKTNLADYSSNADRGKVMRGTWNEKYATCRNNVQGNAINLAVLLGIKMTDLPNVFDRIKEEMQNALENEDDAIALYKKYLRAEERYTFFNNETQGALS